MRLEPLWSKRTPGCLRRKPLSASSGDVLGYGGDMNTDDQAHTPPRSHDINTERAFSDDWRVATAEIYSADRLFQQTILCRLFSRGCFPDNVQAALERLNFPTHHYVLTLPPEDIAEDDVALLEGLDLCTEFNEYVQSLRTTMQRRVR